MPFKFRIKSWPLAILALLGISLFVYLGMWQLNRAAHKTNLFNLFKQRTERAPFKAHDLNQPFDWRYYRAQLEGSFDNQHTILLDNKTYKGQIGYEVYTPFKLYHSPISILIDRGFIAAGPSRSELPDIHSIDGDVTILGMFNTPPTYVTLGKMTDAQTTTWPLRVEYVNPAALAKLIGYDLFHYVLIIDPHDPNAYPVEWQITTMSPDKHKGYAVQWFALAFTLLILFVALSRDRS